jgi:hypothetical protein
MIKTKKFAKKKMGLVSKKWKEAQNCYESYPMEYISEIIRTLRPTMSSKLNEKSKSL